MNKKDLSNFAHKTQAGLVKHSPDILMGLGVLGIGTTIVLAVKATPKALDIIEEEKELSGVNQLSPVDTAKATWKCYMPAVVTGVASMACIVGSRSITVRRTAALTTAYKISTTALSEYKDAVIETIGEKKEKVVKEKMAEKKLKDNPISTKEVYITSKGETLFYDAWSGRYFKSDIEQIKRAVNRLNRSMTTDMSGYISLNEFYDEIGLGHTEPGKVLGWHINDGLIDINLYSNLAENGTPCAVIDFYIAPTYDYKRGY